MTPWGGFVPIAQKQNAPRVARGAIRNVDKSTYVLLSICQVGICRRPAIIFLQIAHTVHSHLSSVSSPARVGARSARPESGRPSTPQRIDPPGITGSPACAGDDTVGYGLIRRCSPDGARQRAIRGSA